MWGDETTVHARCSQCGQKHCHCTQSQSSTGSVYGWIWLTFMRTGVPNIFQGFLCQVGNHFLDAGKRSISKYAVVVCLMLMFHCSQHEIQYSIFLRRGHFRWLVALPIPKNRIPTSFSKTSWMRLNVVWFRTCMHADQHNYMSHHFGLLLLDTQWDENHYKSRNKSDLLKK